MIHVAVSAFVSYSFLAIAIREYSFGILLHNSVHGAIIHGPHVTSSRTQYMYALERKRLRLEADIQPLVLVLGMRPLQFACSNSLTAIATATLTQPMSESSISMVHPTDDDIQKSVDGIHALAVQEASTSGRERARLTSKLLAMVNRTIIIGFVILGAHGVGQDLVIGHQLEIDHHEADMRCAASIAREHADYKSWDARVLADLALAYRHDGDVYFKLAMSDKDRRDAARPLRLMLCAKNDNPSMPNRFTTSDAARNFVEYAIHRLQGGR